MIDDGARLARDARHRALALDPGQSFLVQSPAGSGKTELLIQRYLALLATVERPERIVAMTFTKKAAGEMRERVVAALRAAAQGDAPIRFGAHHAKTHELARAALARDAAMGWELLAHPARMTIQTIDAFCLSLARQAPLASGFGAIPRITEQAAPLYREAARMSLAQAEPDDPHWRVLLAQLDNDAEEVVKLLSSMLERREQWLPVFTAPDPAGLRERLEAVLQSEIDNELAQLVTLFASEERALLECARYAVPHLRELGGRVPLADVLAHCAERRGLPPADWRHHEDWRELANWLLTKEEAQLRKVVTKNGGFPAEGKDPGKARRGAAKADAEALLQRLAEIPGVTDALDLARNLPQPAYDDTGWAMVSALLAILPRAAAQLEVTFAENGTVDFAQATLAALRALGPADEPSDLMLRLDLALDHLLIDEFQDTSAAQYDLVLRLTSGWSEGDGRTLFAVGDPMQSIYRFRNAEVRLFLEAQAAGRIGSVAVHPIDLSRNFRSQAEVVTWINRVFAGVLAPGHDPWRGAVSFSAALPVHPARGNPVPTLDVVTSDEGEAGRVVDLARAALAADAPEIAILVRTRRALDRILPALRAAGIDYAAVELDALGARQATHDLASLAHALLQPADPLAALSMLRAPWCALVLADLLAVSKALDGGLPSLLAAPDRIEGLSADGAARLARMAQVLLPSYAERGRRTLVAQVRGAWLALGGPATLPEAIDLDTADAFFEILGEHEAAGDVRDWNAFVDALGKPRAAPREPGDVRVQVMTLHKAKGLEFDTVIIPGLQRADKGNDPELLRWRARPRGIMLAGLGAHDAVFDYLAHLARVEEDHELGRLLYVGATRAKTRLHLVASAKTKADPETHNVRWVPPVKGSALAKLWPPLGDSLAPPEAADSSAAHATFATPPLLERFAPGFELPPLPVSLPSPRALRTADDATRPAFDWAHATAAAIGTVTHRWLAQIAHDGLAQWDVDRVAAVAAKIAAELAAAGVEDKILDSAADDVAQALRRVLGDERGRWLFAESHEDARSEWALAGLDAGGVAHVTLDRTFVADGERWIVDFKTGRHEGGDVGAFLAREVLRYRPQLERYARIVRALDARPIRVALYFPLVEGGWRAWDPEAPAQGSLF
jgi:ATP-dependent exoDNAse (exonuclease V) beta subunit